MGLLLSGPRGLLLPHVQDGFARIMRAAGADAEPNEIDRRAVEVLLSNKPLPEQRDEPTLFARLGEASRSQAES